MIRFVEAWLEKMASLNRITIETLIRFRNSVVILTGLPTEKLPYKILEPNNMLMGISPNQAHIQIVDGREVHVGFHHFADPTFVASFMTVLIEFIGGKNIAINDTFLHTVNGKLVFQNQSGFAELKSAIFRGVVDTFNSVASTVDSTAPIKKTDLN